MVSFLTVTRSSPMWPAIPRPRYTRPGVVPAPTEPGWRCESEPWVSGPRWKWCRLIVPEKPLPLLIAGHVHDSPAAKSVDVEALARPGSRRTVVDAELAHVPHARQVVELAQAGLVSRRAVPVPICTAVYPSRSGVRRRVTVFGSTTSTDTATMVPSSTKI